MSLVIKHQLGGEIQYKSFTPSILNILGIRFNTQDTLNFLKNSKLRDKYTNDYRGFNDSLKTSFNQSLDSYIRGIEDGKIIFSDNGFTKLASVEGISPEMEPYIKDFFLSSIQSNMINPYDESGKLKYSPNLNSIISRSLFGEERSGFMSAWNSLDKFDEEKGLREITNRKKAYAEALRQEANRIETDSSYREKFQFNGWANDLQAYKKTVDALRKHADEIERINDLTSDESWYMGAANAGLNNSDVERFFGTGKEFDDSTGTSVHPDGGFEIQNFLSTKDPEGYYNGKKYIIGDNYENLPDKLKEWALNLLQLYDRKLIQSDWTYWDRYVNQYLENLSPHFSSNDLSVYSVSKGPLSNVGKKFFIRRPTDKYPIEVSLIRNADGTYSAHNKDLDVNIGHYIETDEARAARQYDNFSDLGKPIDFNLSKVIKDMSSINEFFNYIIQHGTEYANPRMYANILHYLSAWLWVQPEYGKKYTNWAPGGNGRPTDRLHGSTFEILGEYTHPVGFIWKFRNYQLKFEFNGPTNYINTSGRGKALDTRNIKSVTVEKATLYKHGGKVKKLEGGGDVKAFLEHLKKLGLNKEVIIPEPQQPLLIEQTPEKTYENLQFKGKPSDADKVRFVAATTDLLSSFLLFPKGTNVASLAGTGVSFLGYVTADVIDVIKGNIPASEAIKLDTKLAALMAFPMFINPTKAKALGFGKRMQNLARIASQYIGTAYALGQIADPETRDDMIRSWSKVTNPTKLDAHDLTNIAFTIRIVAGGKEHVKSFKRNRQAKQENKARTTAQTNALTGEVKYTIKNGEESIDGSLEVKHTDALDVLSLRERILEKHKELNPKEEDITILNKVEPKGSLQKGKDKVEKILTGKEAQDEVQVKWVDLPIEEGTLVPETQELEWIPERAFLNAILENGIISRPNTKMGNWLRGIFGPDWDLSFSDYRLTKGYRLGKIEHLAKGLYKSLDDLRKQGRKLEEIRKAEGITEEVKADALIALMLKYGYNVSDKEATLKKANELADFYKSDLSKYDNLLLALMMYDKDKENGLFGKVAKTEKAETSEVPSKLNPDELHYNSIEEITPELLKEAYNKFLAEKTVEGTNASPASEFGKILATNPQYRDERRILVSRVFSNFNKESTRALIQSQEEILKKLMKLNSISNKIKNGEAISTAELNKAFKKLLDSNLISEADYNLLMLASKTGELTEGTVAHDLWQQLNAEATKNKTVLETPAETKEKSDEEKPKEEPKEEKSEEKPEEPKEEPKYVPKKKNINLKPSVIKSKQNQKSKEMRLKRFKHGLQRKKFMLGGEIDFVNLILYAAEGNKILKYQYGGGIQSTGSWYNDFLLPGLQDVDSDLRKLLNNPNGEYDILFTPESPDSLYNTSYNYYNMRKEYDNTYRPQNGYYTDDKDTVKKYQEWIYKYLPSLIRSNTNKAYGKGRYSKAGKQLTGTYLGDEINYTADNKFADITRDWHLGNIMDITDSNEQASWLKWLSDLQEEYKDRYTFYLDNTDGSLSIYSNNSDVSDLNWLTPLNDYISTNNIDLSTVNNPLSSDDNIQTLEEISDLQEDKNQEGTNEAAGANENKETLPEPTVYPPDWFTQLPKDNLTAARILNTLFGNAATDYVRNIYKPLFAKDLSYLKTARVYGDVTDINEVNNQYGQFLSRQLGVSSDMRVNIASALDLMSKYNTAMRQAQATNKKAWDASMKEVISTANDNAYNLATTYNANLKKYTDEMRLLQEYSAGAAKQKAQNVSNLFSTLIQEKGTDRLYARKSYLDAQMTELSSVRDKEKLEALLFYYRQYKSKAGNENKTLNDFLMDLTSQEYLDLVERIRTLDLVYKQNVQNLYEAIYNPNLFRNQSGYVKKLDIFNGLTRDEKTTVKKSKSGGIINMAKQGGASVNWVRVENARMLNKAVNTSLTETYKSLRAANTELLKTIRAMEPLIRKLNRRDSVKLK